MSGVRSVVDYDRYRSQHHEGSRPKKGYQYSMSPKVCYLLTLIAACKALAISLSCSSLGLLPRISGNQN
jgi:hypothetical protein